MSLRAMWLCALLTIAALHEVQPRRIVRNLNIDPTAISNIELLIPLTVNTEQQEHEDPNNERYTIGSDESFSAIPGYAFTLDQESVTPRTRTYHALPKYIKNRSLYLAQLWPRFNAQSKEQTDRASDTSHKVSQEACRVLAQQQKGSARELMLYLCTELIDVLPTRCDCCDKEYRSSRMHGAASDRLNYAGPLFGPLGGRREQVSRPIGIKNRVNVK